MYALVNINNSETWDLISDKPAIRKETTVIRTYDYELSETTVMTVVSFLIAGLSKIRS